MLSRHLYALLTAGLACLLLAAGSAQAKPGAQDLSFGTTGTVTTSIGADAAARTLAVQPDGKIVAVGNSLTAPPQVFALARYNPDGSLDTSFGAGGKVTTSFGGEESEASAVVLQPDGKIVVAGYDRTGGFDYMFALARYNPDGALDPRFGTGGQVTTAIDRDTEGYAVALQPNGKIVVAGSSSDGVTRKFALARYNPDGSLDTGFGTAGKVTTTVVGAHDFDSVYALALQPDGKLVAAGVSDGDFALVRYVGNGTLDPSFGNGGKVTTATGSSDDEASALALQPDGGILAAGYSSDGSRNVFALVRYDPDGSLDPGFGTDGKVTSAIGSVDLVRLGLALQPDGKILAVGDSSNGSRNVFAVVRYDADGALDPSFGTGGQVTTAIGSTDDQALGVALQVDGRIVVAGASKDDGHYRFALARFEGSTLAVSVAGGGSGTVTSSLVGIACNSSCSAPLAAGPVTLTATPAPGSVFSGWSGGGCSGTGTCQLQMSTDEAVTAIFTLLPQTLAVTMTSGGAGSASSGFLPAPCVVPRVTGNKLAAARKTLRQAHCSLGRVTRAFSARVKRGRVISQSRAPRKSLPGGAQISLIVSRGRRPHGGTAR